MLKADTELDAEFIQECSAKLGFDFVPDRMRDKFESIPDWIGPLNIRSAFMGGEIFN